MQLLYKKKENKAKPQRTHKIKKASPRQKTPPKKPHKNKAINQSKPQKTQEKKCPEN